MSCLNYCVLVYRDVKLGVMLHLIGNSLNYTTGVSERLLLNANGAIFQLYYCTNKFGAIVQLYYCANKFGAIVQLYYCTNKFGAIVQLYYCANKLN